MFFPVTENLGEEKAYRERLSAHRIPYGVSFLDEATRQIWQTDFVLMGALSGAGKTQLCCSIARSAIEQGKRVNFIALEASEFEIQQRLLYPLVMDEYFADPFRPHFERKLEFEDWLICEHAEEMNRYEQRAYEKFYSLYKNLFVYEKESAFDIGALVKAVALESQDAGLIIVDHAHYLDLEDDNENRAMKQLAKTCRDLVLEEQKPIVLVAHLRKRDRGVQELAPDMAEFMGSSDLAKIATRVITFGPGRPTGSGGYETFFRIPKNRAGAGVSRFVARCIYSPQKGSYEKNYRLGWASQSSFEDIDATSVPDWASSSRGQASLDVGNHRPIRNYAPGSV